MPPLIEHFQAARGGLFALLAIALLVLPSFALDQSNRSQEADEQAFKSAASDYESHQYDRALTELSPLATRFPKSFEVNELMGLILAARGDDAKAVRYFRLAANLDSKSSAAHTNLASCLFRLRESKLAESEFKKGVELESNNYGANHNLGEFYIQSGNIAAAIPYLEKAQRINPLAYENGYDLSLAYLETQRFGDASKQLRELVRFQDTAELHNLLGKAEEKEGHYLQAAQEYEKATQMDPSEANIFDWGLELLQHQTLDPAIQVFTAGAQRYPNSARMEIGLGIAFFARGYYDKAVGAFARATDLAPKDPRPYLFLGKAYNISDSQAEGVSERLRRFMELEAGNGQARYYYAMSLWKGKRTEGLSPDLSQVERLLKDALKLDPTFADAHLQLGNLYSEQAKFPQAISEYHLAVKCDPDLAGAYYRLGQLYIRTGEKQLAQEQFKVYERLHDEQGADAERRRREIKKFIYSMTGGRDGNQAESGSPH